VNPLGEASVSSSYRARGAPASGRIRPGRGDIRRSFVAAARQEQARRDRQMANRALPDLANLLPEYIDEDI